MTCTALPRSVIKQQRSTDPKRIQRFELVCEVRANHPIMVPSAIGRYVEVEAMRNTLRAAGLDPATVGL